MTHQSLRIGDTAPDFKAQTSAGEISWHEYLGNSWGLLASHPADFTPVCTTELGELARREERLARKGVKVAAISVDPLDKHLGWIKDINETQQVEVKYPIIADADRKISNQYGMLDQTELDASGMPLTVRAVFLIDPAKKIRWIIIYPASCGRNFDEIERCIDSLMLTNNRSVTTPANWQPGQDVIVAPNVSDDKAKELFGDFRTVKPYLRFTKQPQL